MRRLVSVGGIGCRARATQGERMTASESPTTGYVLAVDLGTGGPKVALVSLDGESSATSTRRNDLILLPDGGVEQDPEQWWTSIVTATRRLLARGLVPVDDMVAVSITTQWMTTVAVGADGHHIGNAISWMDTRGARYAAAGGRRRRGRAHGRLQRQEAAPVAAASPAASRRAPARTRSARCCSSSTSGPRSTTPPPCFLEPMDYLNLRLTGRAVASIGHHRRATGSPTTATSPTSATTTS